MIKGREDLGSKFIRRSNTSIILVFLVWIIVYKIPLWAFALTISIFIAFSQFEFFKMVQKRDIFVYKYFGTIVGALVPVVIWLGYGSVELSNLEPFLIIIACLFMFTLQFIRKDNTKDHLVSIAVTLFSLFYISWFFSFFVKLRMLADGANLVSFLIIVVKGGDIGAYIGGERLGKNELVPRISPNKTKEGLLSGIIISVLFAALLGPYLIKISPIHAALIGVGLAVLGQTGDLAESLIKRNCGVKDSARYLGDIGGCYDLIDSLLFSAPIFSTG